MSARHSPGNCGAKTFAISANRPENRNSHPEIQFDSERREDVISDREHAEDDDRDALKDVEPPSEP
jgi:hypothetical protein